ncbi:MAG: DUF6456 domain-containing protein [Pseudomonadota bacterium]
MRALVKGGVAVERPEGFAIYRTADARRGVVAILSRASFQELLDGDCVEQRGDRYTWRAGCLPKPATKPNQPGTVTVSARNRPRTLIEKALARCNNEEEVLRLTEAIRRFVTDITAAESGQVVTMNWDMIPKGRSSARSGIGPGQSQLSVLARQRVTALSTAIDRTSFDLLVALLCHDVSERRLAVDFGHAVRSLPAKVHRYLTNLADTYDRYVPNR